MPKVTVVIPIYGVEKYIERCARSLFEQTLDDIEYIFINDCTPDGSMEILDRVMTEYPARKAQVRIEKMMKNSGLPKVRKRGIEMATGDFVIACDSDDWVDANMYGDMYEEAIRNGLDLVHCNIDIVDDATTIATLSCNLDNPTSDELKMLILNGVISNSLCNKLVKRDIYIHNAITYPQFGMDEDNALAIQLAYYANKLGYVNKAYYKACLNEGSISRSAGKDRIVKRFDESWHNSKIIIDFFKCKGFKDDDYAVLKATTRPKLILWPLIEDNKYLQLWKDTYPETNAVIIFDRRFPKSTRIKYFLAKTYLYKLFFIFQRIKQGRGRKNN